MSAVRVFGMVGTLMFGPVVGTALKPVILVPGLTGSGLEVREDDAFLPHFYCTASSDDYFRIWLELGQLLLGIKDCLIERLTLIYDESTGLYSNLPGIDMRPIDFGGVDGVSYLDGTKLVKQYVDIVKALKGRGYTVGENLHGAPYDWRLAGDAHASPANGVGGMYKDLQTMIEDSVSRAGHKAVVVSHSLGCPTMLYFFHTFVSEAWRVAHIDRWVALAGPWGGTVTQTESYIGGNTFGLPLPHDYVKPVQVNATSGIWVSPQAIAFGDATVISTPSRNYSSGELPTVVQTIGAAAGGDQALALFRKDSIDLKHFQKPPAGVPMHIWYGTGVDTAEIFVYDKDITTGFNRAPDKVIKGDGDGTVNLVSLQLPEKTWPKVTNAPFEVKSYAGTSHSGMLSNSDVLSDLLRVLGLPALSDLEQARLRNDMAVAI